MDHFVIRISPILLCGLLFTAIATGCSYQSKNIQDTSPEQSLARELEQENTWQPDKPAPKFKEFNLHQRHGLGGWQKGQKDE